MPVLYYVRHGETDLNRQGRLQGRRDIPLNAHGRRQAAECGVLLRDLFARDHRQAQDLKYVSSPLKRARETMEILRATLGLQAHDYEIDARLIEIAYGEWEGLTLQEIEMRNASVLSATSGILRRPAVRAIANSLTASTVGTSRSPQTPSLRRTVAVCAR
jgi:broad specificity phosphatase PhoE